MKAFRITITFADPFPKTSEHIEKANGFDYACKKALKKFRVAYKGRRIEDFALRCQDLGTYCPEGKRTKIPVSRDPAMKTLDEFFERVMA